MSVTESRTLHFDLSHLSCDGSLTFHQSAKTYAMRAHDDASRATARTDLAFLALIPDANLTHYVDVADLPRDQVVLTYVTTRRTIGDQEVDAPIHLGIYLPQRGRTFAAAQIKKGRSANDPGGVHPALARFGVTREQFSAVAGDSDDPEFPVHIVTFQDALDAAIALLFHHPNLINLNDENSSAYAAYIVAQHITPAITAGQELTLEILREGDAYLVVTTYKGPDGTPATSANPSPTVQTFMTGPLQTALRTSQADPYLAGQQWNYEYGSTTAGYNGGMTTAPAGQAELRSTGDTWVARAQTPMHGLSIDASSIVVTPAPPNDAWLATGVWSQSDTPSFSSDMVAALEAGSLYLQVASVAPVQTLSGQLVLASAPDPDTGLTDITVTLTPIGTPPEGSKSAVTAKMTLNSGESGLAYTVEAEGLMTTAATVGIFSGSGSAPTMVYTLEYSMQVGNLTGLGSMSVTCTNSWVRHLSACVQYYDVAGKQLTPPKSSWPEKLPQWLRGTFEPDPKTKFLDLVAPVVTIFGVPIPATPTTLTFPIWEEVNTVRLEWGGLGRGAYDPAVCPIGLVATALAELVLPPFMLALGTAITNSKFVVTLLADEAVLYDVIGIGTFLVAGSAVTAIELSQDPSAAATGLMEKFGPMLLSPATALGKWVLKKVSASAAADAIPFIDVALYTVKCAVTAAELSQTIVEVLDSPFVYSTDLIASVDMDVTINPDPRYNKFPDDHDHFTLTVVYDVGTTQPTYSAQLDKGTLTEPIHVTFKDVPAGGTAQACAFFYTADGWQSGQGVGAWTPVVGTNGVCNLSVTVTTNEVPLTVDSVYYHVEKIALVGGSLAWEQALDKPPTATMATVSPFKGKAVQKYCGMTMAQQAEMIGLCYQAIGLDMPPNFITNKPSNDALYMLENLSVMQKPSLGTSTPAVAFVSSPGTAYNMSSAEGTTGTCFFIDSSAGEFDPVSNPAGGYHVRGIVLTHDKAPVFTTSSNQSYGRFPLELDRYVFHPQGLVMGISLTTHKIYILTLASAPVSDVKSPTATMASGQGARDGLIYGPCGIAVALDGRVLVLESLNNRIQAFDICGKPVQYFAGASGKATTMSLNSQVGSMYLDIAVESKGYIYVLYYTGDGSAPSNYCVDIYDPDGTFLVSTPNVAAANIVVDILRNLFTLNYETILDAKSRPQPSVSHWMPPAPAVPQSVPSLSTSASTSTHAQQTAQAGGA